MSDILPLCAVLALAISVGVCARLRMAAQPLRLEMADKAERLLVRPDLPLHLSQRIGLYLDTAFGFRWPLVLGICAMPVMLVKLLIHREIFWDLVRQEASIAPEIKGPLDEINALHQRITLANNPVLTVLFELEVLLLVPFALLLFGTIAGRMPVGMDRNMVASMVEARPQQLRQFLAA